MDTITLYTAPGTCGRVTAVLLEEAGLAYTTQLVRFMKGEHRRPDFLQLNPLGKVPVLHIDGVALTENLAIARYLAARCPEAQLLPAATTLQEQARIDADLAFCAATLHPVVTRIRLPHFFAGDTAAQQVWELACSTMAPYFSYIEARLQQQPWWYGEQFSAMDAWLGWIYWRVAGAGYPAQQSPSFTAHQVRLMQRPSLVAVMAREAADLAQLEAEGNGFVPPTFPFMRT